MDFSRVLSDGQVERFRGAGEDLLERVGFRVKDEAALAACKAAGARVEEVSGTVRLPRALLRELAGYAPRTYAIGGAGGSSWEVGKEPLGLAIVTDPWIIDYDTGRPRRPCLADVKRHTAIAQKMPGVAAVSRMDFPVSDIDGPNSSLRAWEEHLILWGKHHLFVPAGAESNRRWHDLACILRNGAPGEAPLFSVMAAVISPLVISGINVDLVRFAIGHGAPVQPTVCPMAGSTAPYSLAGTLVQGHAENMALLALTQVLSPGHPFLYAFGPSVTDMRSGHDLYYTMDKVLWKVASVQLAKSYGLPAAAECGGTMTFRYDPQCGAEGFAFMMAALASGADILAGFGSCYTAMGMSAEMMLIQQAWLDAARYLGRGISTEPLDEAMAAIERVGPGGEFLTDESTLGGMRESEFFTSACFDHTPVGEAGPGPMSRGMLERAHEEAERLGAEQVSPLPGDVQEGIRRFFHDECARS